jgi:hypothetical protein
MHVSRTRWRAPLLCILFAFATLFTACPERSEGLIVNLQTDLRAGVEFDAVRVTIDGADARTLPVSTTSRFTQPSLVTQYDTVATGRHLVRVSLMEGASERVSRSLTIQFNRSYLLTAIIASSCLDVPCETGFSCSGARCVPNDCVTGTELSCPRPACVRDADCMRTGASCAQPTCASGVCLETPNDALCGPGEVCVVSTGCVATASDAGRPDAAMSVDATLPIDAPVGPCGTLGCRAWVLRRGATEWTAVPRTPDPLGPTTPVRDVFDVESLRIAYVLTDTTFHVMRLSDMTYTSSGLRNELLPRTAGMMTRSSGSSPAGAGQTFETVGIVVASFGAHIYHLDLATRAMTFVVDAPFGADWSTPSAPNPALIRVGWLAGDNDAGWVTGSPQTLCETPSTRTTTYIAFVTDTAVHISDSTCGAFYPPIPHESFAPFTLPGAPMLAGVAAGFYSGGELWALAP